MNPTGTDQQQPTGNNEMLAMESGQAGTNQTNDRQATDGERCSMVPCTNEQERLELTQRLIEDHHDRVHRYALLLSGSRTAAEDISQEVFLRAFANVHQLRSIDTAGGWLMAITRNEVARWCGRWGTSQELIVEPPDRVSEEADLEEHEWVHRAIQQLPIEFRQVVLMFYFEQKSYVEIATELELPMGTVMSRLNRARGHLKTALLELAEPVRARASNEIKNSKESSQ